jgi:hypothetical protein
MKERRVDYLTKTNDSLNEAIWEADPDNTVRIAELRGQKYQVILLLSEIQSGALVDD